MARFASDVAREHVNNMTAAGAAYAAIPIPGHCVGLTILEGVMAANIARIYGIRPEGAAWSIILKLLLIKLGGAALLKGVVEALNFIPIIGWIAKPVVAGGFVKGLGEVFIDFFESRFPRQTAYEKPGWEALVAAFGPTLLAADLRDLYDSYDSTSPDELQGFA